MTRDEARKALADDGFKSGFSSPGRPELWLRGKERVALARTPSGAWKRLLYPEPATATPAQVAELAKRDGIVLQAGKMPNPEDVTIQTSSAGTGGEDEKSASDGAAPEQRQSEPEVPATDLDDVEI